MATNKSRMTEALLQARETALLTGSGDPKLICLSAAISCTLSNATNIVQDVAHGLTNGIRVKIEGTAIPAELDDEIYYYVVNKNNDDFQISLTEGGAAVTFTTDGTSVTYKVVGVEITLNSDPFDAPTSDATKSTMAANVSPVPSNAPDIEIVVTNADWVDSDETIYWNTTVSESGGGGELIMNNSTLALGVAVNLVSCYIYQAF